MTTTRLFAIALAGVISAAASTQSQAPPRLGLALFSAFVGRSDADVSQALSYLTVAERNAVEKRLQKRRAYRPALAVPETARGIDEEMWESRRDFEAGIATLANTDKVRDEATVYARDFTLSYEWEGFADGPLAEAAYAERYLGTHPGTRLASALNLFLLHRYRSAFEAAVFERTMWPGSGSTISSAAWDAEQDALKHRAADGYVVAWDRLQRVNDVVIKAVAEDLDEQAYLYQNAGSQHPRRPK